MTCASIASWSANTSLTRPISLALLGRQAAAGVGELAHPAFGDEFAEAREGADVGGHADVDFLDRRRRRLGAVADVAGAGHVDAAADAAALDRGDHRHARLVEAGEAVLQAQHELAERLGGDVRGPGRRVGRSPRRR